MKAARRRASKGDTDSSMMSVTLSEVKMNVAVKALLNTIGMEMGLGLVFESGKEPRVRAVANTGKKVGK